MGDPTISYLRREMLLERLLEHIEFATANGA